MHDKTFSLTKSDNILIYGCGSQGEQIGRGLIDQGYQLKAFIDRNAKKIANFMGIKVLEMKDLDFLSDTNSYIVIISLRSGMDHEPVAKEFAKMGFQKIIYIQMHRLISYTSRHNNRSMYQHLCDCCFHKLKDIPIYDIHQPSHPIRIITENANGKVAFWCPTQLLRAPTKEYPTHSKDFHTKEDIEDYMANYVERKFTDLPHTEIYKWLKGIPSNIELYLKFVHRNAPDVRDKWLQSRKELYKIYKDALQYDISFFTDAPTPCSWNTNGYFNYSEGATRAHFLISEGYDLVPVITPLEDFNKGIDTIIKALSQNNDHCTL